MFLACLGESLKNWSFYYFVQNENRFRLSYRVNIMNPLICVLCVSAGHPRNIFTCSQPWNFWRAFLWIMLTLLEKKSLCLVSFLSTASVCWTPASRLWFPHRLLPALHQCRDEWDCREEGWVPPYSGCYQDSCASHHGQATEPAQISKQSRDDLVLPGRPLAQQSIFIHYFSLLAPSWINTEPEVVIWFQCNYYTRRNFKTGIV